MADRNDDWFYVGYLPLPRRHLAFLRIAIPVILWGMTVSAGVIAWQLRAGGDGVWDTATERTWTGVVHLAPYPWIEIESGPDGTPGALPVVRTGKHGAQERLGPFAGQRVTLTGFALNRDGREMIELADADDAIATVAEAAPTLTARTPISQSLGDVLIEGEIADYKCYLGAMRPGSGKAHQACAELCIAGGIPAVLIFPGAGGPQHHLLAAPDGTSAADLVADHIGIPVTVGGQLERLPGGLTVLRIDPDALSRRD